MNSETSRSGSGTPQSGNCADCGAPLPQYADADVDRGGGGGGGRRCVDEISDVQLHQQPVWISKNLPDQTDEPIPAWNRTIDPEAAADDGQTNNSIRSKSLDRTFCIRTSASPSPRRVVRHKTPPPFQLHKASSSSTAASPAAPRWDGISVWIPNTDLCARTKTRTVSDCDPHSGGTSSLKKTASFRSRGARSGDSADSTTSPGFRRSLHGRTSAPVPAPAPVPVTTRGTEEELQRVPSSCGSCVTQGHLQQQHNPSSADRKTCFSIFGRDAPDVQRQLTTTMGSSTSGGKKQMERCPSSEANSFGRLLQSPDGSVGQGQWTRRSDDSGTPPGKRLDSTIPPPPLSFSSIRSEQLDRFLGGNVLPSHRHKTPTQSSTLTRPSPSQKERTLSGHGNEHSSPLSSDLRRFPSSDIHRTSVEGKPSSNPFASGPTPGPTPGPGSGFGPAASYSMVSGFVGSLPRRVVGIGSAAEETFSPVDVLNWKLSLMDSDAVRVYPGSDDFDDSMDGSGAYSSPSPAALGSIEGQSDLVTTATSFSFEETLEEVLEEGGRPTNEQEEEDDDDEGSSFDEKDRLRRRREGPSMTESDRRHLESSLDVFERHLDRLLMSQVVLDPAVDPIATLMTNLELYRDRMIGRQRTTSKKEHPKGPPAPTAPTGGPGDTRTQFLSLTAGVECIRSDTKLHAGDSNPVAKSSACPYVEDQLNTTTADDSDALVRHRQESRMNAERGCLLREQREGGSQRRMEQRQCSSRTPSGGSNTTAFNSHRHLNGANIPRNTLDLTSELELPRQDRLNHVEQKAKTSDSAPLHRRESPPERKLDSVAAPSFQFFVPRDKSFPSEAESRFTGKAIQIADQQKQGKGENERREGIPGLSRRSVAEANDLCLMQQRALPVDASCPTRGRSKPCTVDCISTEGVQTNDDLDGDGPHAWTSRPEGSKAFIAVQDYGDSDGYFSSSVPRSTAGGVRTSDAACSHGRFVPSGLDGRDLGACFSNGRSLDPRGGCDGVTAQPNADRHPIRQRRGRGDYDVISVSTPPLSSAAGDAIRSGDDDDDGGCGGWSGPRLPYSAIRTSDQKRTAAADDNAADVAENGMPKSIVDGGGGGGGGGGIDLLTCRRRRAPEGGSARRRRSGGGGGNHEEEEAEEGEERASSGNKIAFDEVSRRVSSAEGEEASNETPLLIRLLHQNADVTKSSTSAPATSDEGRQALSIKCQQHQQKPSSSSNHVSCCNRVLSPVKMVVMRGGGEERTMPGRTTTQRPRLLWDGTTAAAAEDGGKTHEAHLPPPSAPPYITTTTTTSRNHRPLNGIVDLRESVRSVLDRMTERTLLCLQDDEEPEERTDYAGAPLQSKDVDAGTRPARTDSVKSRLVKIRHFQEEFLQELARLDGQRAVRLGRLHRRVEELERLVYSIFGEDSTREGVVVKKFVISSASRVAAAEEWENPRTEQPDEVNIIVLKDGINIEGLHVDGACDSKPIRVQQQEIQRLYNSAVIQMSSHRNAETNLFEDETRWRPTNHDCDSDRQRRQDQILMEEVDSLPPPPAEWST